MTTMDLDLSRAAWPKSTYSNNGGSCVKVALGKPDAAAVAVRDSKDPDGPTLAFTPYAWRRFARRVRSAAR